MSRSSRGLAAAIAAGSFVVGAAGAAPAATSLDPSTAPQLRVVSPDLLDPGQVTIIVGNEPVARVTLRIPKGYVFAANVPVGADVGFAAGLGSADLADASLGGGTLTLADPNAVAADPTAQACDPNPHLAVLTAPLDDETAGATAELTVFVDGPGTDATAAYVLEYCPPLLAGQQLAVVELLLDGRVLEDPDRPAVYTWSAFVTPSAPGGTAPDEARTIELRAEVPIPESLALAVRYDAEAHTAVLSGRYTKVGRPQRGVAVGFHAAGARSSADFGPVRTDAQGRFTYRWAINGPTAFAAHVASAPPRPCTGSTAAPGGCLSTTTSEPIDASVEVVPRTARDPRLAIRPADMRRAAGIGLERGELPAGWHALPAGAGPRTSCEGFHPQASDLTETGSHSATFVSRPSFDFAAVAASSVTIFATRREAAAYFARDAKPGRFACFLDEARSSGGTANMTRIPAAELAPGSVGFRIRLEQQDQTYYFDDIGVLGARSVTFLLLTSEGGPPSLEQRLTARIAARARRG